MNQTADTAGIFSTDVAGLANATPSEVVALADGDTFELRIAAVAKNLGDDRVRMLSYSGSIPGPTLRVRQGSEVVVHVRNDGDMDAAKQWLREKGLAASAKRDERENTQGAVGLFLNGNVGAMVELTCETDFVARTEHFKQLANELATLVALHDDHDAVGPLVDQ